MMSEAVTAVQTSQTDFEMEFCALPQAERDALVGKLLGFTKKYLSRKGLIWNRVQSSLPDVAQNAQNHAFEAILKAMDGRRKWKANSGVGMLTFLVGIVKSDVSHRLTSAENRLFREYPASEGEDDAGVETNEESYQPSVQQQIYAREMIALIRKRVAEAGDKQVDDLLATLECGVTDRKEIAATMGIAVTEYDNIRKRLRRLIEALKEREEGK